MRVSATNDTLRRSSRVPVNVPVLVTSLSPGSDFSEICETLVVSAHGCAMQSTTKLDAGLPVHFQSKQGRRAKGHIVNCQPLNSGRHGWKVAATLDQPQNFWGLESCPEDWLRLLASSAVSDLPPLPQSTSPDSDLQKMIDDLIHPLQEEVAELRQKLAQTGGRRSQFDISLTHIPAEVEEKLWVRLRDDLGAQVLQQTHQQAEQVLETAKEAIGKKIREAQHEFRLQLTEELKTVEQQADELAQNLGERVDEYVQAGGEKFKQQALEAGIRLERRSEEYLRSLQERLGEEHENYRREMQEVHTGVTAEASRLKRQTDDLDTRIGRLDDSARRLESDLDARLVRMGSDIIAGARTQLATAVDEVLKELGTRNAKQLEAKLDEACAQLNATQKRIEASVSELLKTEVAGTLVSFGQTIEELAQDSVGRWRLGLSRDLHSVAGILGQDFRAASLSENREEPQE